MRKLNLVILLAIAISLLLPLNNIAYSASTNFTTTAVCVVRGYHDNYASCRNLTASQEAEQSSIGQVGQRFQSGYYKGDYSVYRERLCFDTSSIPDGATITAAILCLNGFGDHSETDFDVTVVDGSACSCDSCSIYYYGYLRDENTDGGHLTSSGWSASWNNITLDADGRGWINKTSNTILGLRSSREISCTTPTQDEYILFEAAGANKPILKVTYEASATPEVTTKNATYITLTTARLNSYLDADNGEACDIRFQYGNSTGNYTSNTSWINDTYWQGSTPYVNVASLTANTTYYFRVQAANSQGTTNGSELTFNTTSESSHPVNLTAYPFSHSVSLVWTKGVATTNTMVRGQAGSYPTNYTKGDQVYFGTMATATHSGLSPGTAYYYRAWGESGGNYTANYTETMTITYAGVPAPDTPDAPDVPSGWFGSPDYTNMEDFPLYSMVNDLADGVGMPRNSFWILGAMLLVAIVGLFIYKTTDSGIAGLLTGGALIAIFSLQFGVPLWIIFAFGILVSGVFIVQRRT